jgi:hypothetical protein
MATSLRAQQHQLEREGLANATARAVLAEWSKVNPDAVANSWVSLLPRVTAMVQAGQLHAAEGTHTFMRELLGPNAVLDAPEIEPEQFASTTPDGRNLVGVLARAIPTVLSFLGQGESLASSMLRGATFLDFVVRTVVADTGRQADQAAMVANRKVTSYIRVVEGGSCSRCLILAGREYGVSSGFLRHPRCHCTMEPVTREHTPKPSSPKTLFDRLSATEQRKAFGEAGAKAINDGADMSDVVNARKAMDSVEMFGKKVQVTYVNTGSRRRKQPPRLTPEEIYKQSDGDRDHAIRLLRKNGYLR